MPSEIRPEGVPISEMVEKIKNIQIAQWNQLHEEMSFWDYLNKVSQPHFKRFTRNAYERVFDMITEIGYEEYIEDKKSMRHYKFFDAPIDSKDKVFGIDASIQRLIRLFEAATKDYGPSKRLFLLHGPVGSSKSTIVRVLKQGLEQYSRSENGKLYSLYWKNCDTYIEGNDRLKKILGGLFEENDHIFCPLQEEPLRIIPTEITMSGRRLRDEIFETLGIKAIKTGYGCPLCTFFFDTLLREYKGDWTKVIDHVGVYRLLLTESKGVGIGSFEPSDEKNQDITELRGDINYQKLAKYGSLNDPRVLDMHYGEFNKANRGIVEFVEVLKLQREFLYALLGATQERTVKPKGFPFIYIDEIIMSHTNNPELKKLENDEFMEAFRDRTIRVDVPYVLKMKYERQIYEKEYCREGERLNDMHISPHSITAATVWALLTRLKDPVKIKVDLLSKLKLYDGQYIGDYKEDDLIELKKESAGEGLDGISPRYINDKIADAMVSDDALREKCMNGFTILGILREGLRYSSLKIEDKKRYEVLISEAEKEYGNLIKKDAKGAIGADKESEKRIAQNYIDNVKAYTQKTRIKDKFTGQEKPADERLLRSIEEKIGITENQKDEFRKTLMNRIGADALDGKPFDYILNEKLKEAIEKKLFEDAKDTLKLESLASSVTDKETKEKINTIKERLITVYHYCDICAMNVLDYISSAIARGEAI
ncbi:MAG: serine protein kinase [Parcubacteria group bacterium]|nr:serine protein kinase [Parcubacteria group bacterium]